MNSPNIPPSRRRGAIRLSIDELCSPGVESLTALEFRAFVKLISFVARYGDGEGEVLLDDVLRAELGKASLTPRVLRRLELADLIWTAVYDDEPKAQVVIVSRWRALEPADATSSERKRRHRRKVYGSSWHGTEGGLQELRLSETQAEIEAIEREGRAFLDGLEEGRRWTEAKLAASSGASRCVEQKAAQGLLAASSQTSGI